MSQIQFKNTGSTVPESTIATLEKRLAAHFPDDYRSFLMATNGGQPNPRRVILTECDGSTLVDVLLGIGTVNSLEEWIKELADDLPVGFIPIGFDPGGNAFLMNVKTGSSPKVYYWDSARHFRPSNDKENTFFVANSFTEFLEMLS